MKNLIRKILPVIALVGLIALETPSLYAQTQVNSAQSSAQTAAWTSATGNNTAISATVANMSVVEASFNVTGGTITAGGIVFEASDDGGTTWYAVYATAANAAPPATPVTSFTLTGSNQLWQVDVAGYTNFRIRLNPVITGAGTANVRWLASALASRPHSSAQENLVSVAGAPVVTGVGPGGGGIPRVTVSNDSSLAANQSVNLNQISGSSVVTGTGGAGAGVPRVTVSSDSSLAANQSVNNAQFGGTNTVSGGVSGSLATGGTQANNAAPTQNPDLIGAETNATNADPTTATAGNVRRVSADIAGNVFVRPGGPHPFTCSVTMSTATTTQCQAAPSAGFTAYVTHVAMGTTTAGTTSSLQVKYGTGSNCGTGTTALSPTYPNVAIGSVIDDIGQGAYIPAAANAVCVTQTATAGTSVVTISGFIAP